MFYKSKYIFSFSDTSCYQKLAITMAILFCSGVGTYDGTREDDGAEYEVPGRGALLHELMMWPEPLHQVRVYLSNIV